MIISCCMRTLVREFIRETKESESLSEEEFEKKYGGEFEICKTLGEHGWVVSEHSNPKYIKNWYKALIEDEPEKITEFFEADECCVIKNIVSTLDTKHKDSAQLMSEELIYLATHSNESPFHLIGHLYLAMDYFIRSTSSATPVGGSKLQDFYIKEAITFIERNFQNDISIVDIANVCGINRSYFGKIFKKNIGQTPQEFLMNYRMIKATELLRLTDLSISDINHCF